MEKLTDEMDLTEWDLLSDDEDVVTKGGMLVSAKLDFVPKAGFVMNYFPRSPAIPNHMPKNFKVCDEEVVKEVIKVPIIEINKQDFISSSQQQQVSFEKSKVANKFVDIKIDSPKSKGNNNQETAPVLPFLDLKKDWNTNNGNGKKNMWSWKLTGVGALCSIGMAAATICIFVISSQQRHKQHQQNQKLRFQIYTDDKRFKQVVHQATKLNQAISSVRGGAFNNAHFTFGGYYVYDGL